MLDQLTAAAFAPHVGSTFQVERSGGSGAGLELIEVREVDAGGDRPASLPARQPFSIVFRADASREWAQGVHTLRHARLGRMEIFLVPIGPFPGEARLEAVFG